MKAGEKIRNPKNSQLEILQKQGDGSLIGNTTGYKYADKEEEENKSSEGSE